MKNGMIKDLERILKDENSTPHERTLAVCLIEIKSRLENLERLGKLQIALLSAIISSLVLIAVSG